MYRHCTFCAILAAAFLAAGCSEPDVSKITSANQFVAACVGECDRICREDQSPNLIAPLGCIQEGEYCAPLCPNREMGLPSSVGSSVASCSCGSEMWFYSTYEEDGEIYSEIVRDAK